MRYEHAVCAACFAAAMWPKHTLLNVFVVTWTQPPLGFFPHFTDGHLPLKIAHGHLDVWPGAAGSVKPAACGQPALPADPWPPNAAARDS